MEFESGTRVHVKESIRSAVRATLYKPILTQAGQSVQQMNMSQPALEGWLKTYFHDSSRPEATSRVIREGQSLMALDRESAILLLVGTIAVDQATNHIMFFGLDGLLRSTIPIR
jgi:hypothetical protein